MKKTAHFISTVFYTGHFPVAPGTVGALTGSLAYFFIPYLSGFNLLVITILIFFTGVWASAISEKDLGHDASEINIDELAGILTTYLFIPRYHLLFITFAGFILFRFFDIVKPPPVNRSQNLPHGWGVMIDDVLAGIYANIVLRLLIFLIF